MAILGRKRRPEHKKASGKAFTLVFDNEDRFIPCPHKGDYKQKYQYCLLHPIFLLRSQAEEYAKARIEAGFWKEDTKVVIVEVNVNEI